MLVALVDDTDRLVRTVRFPVRPRVYGFLDGLSRHLGAAWLAKLARVSGAEPEVSKMLVNMHEAKSQLSKLGRLAWEGEEVVIARAGKPYLRLTPYKEPDRRLGLLEGKIWIADDFDETPQDIIDSFYKSDSDDYL